jgi:hypothetical protein
MTLGPLLVVLGLAVAAGWLVKAAPWGWGWGGGGAGRTEFFRLVPTGMPQHDLQAAGHGVEAVAQQMQGSWVGNSNSGANRIRIVRYWDGQELWVLVGCARGQVQAGQLAAAVDARAVPLDNPAVLEQACRVARLRQMQWIGGKQATQNQNTPLDGMANALGGLMSDQHTPSALLATLWPPGRFWFNRYRQWLASRESSQNQFQAYNDPQLQSNIMLAASIAGTCGRDGQPDAVVTTAVTHLPYNSFESVARQPSDLPGWACSLLVALGTAAAVRYHQAGILVAVLVGLAVLVVPGALRLAGGPVAPRRLLRQVRRGELPPDKSIGSWWRRWARTKQGMGVLLPPVPWAMLAPSQVACLLALPDVGGQGAQARHSALRVAPAPLLQPHGPMVGMDIQGRPVYLPDTQLEQGVFATGDPGQGKTVFQLGLWGGLLARRQQQYEDEGEHRHCMIWVETKGEGARRALDMAGRAGLGPSDILYLGIEDPSSPRLELCDREDPLRGAHEITEAMTYSLPKDWIAGRSAAALQAGWRLALSMTPTMVSSLQGRMSPAPAICRALLGGDPDPAAQDHWYEWYRNWMGYYRQNGPGSDPIPGIQALSDALKRMDTYMRVERRQRDEIFRPSVDRLTDLLSVPALWTPRPGRPTWTIRDILRQHKVAIINFGGGTVSPLVAQRMGAMMLYILSAAIQEICLDWQAQGRSVSIFSDEVSHLCGTGSDRDVIGTLKDAGRSWGVRQFYATQRLDQIPDKVQAALRSCDTQLALRTNNVTMAEMAIHDLGGDPSSDGHGFGPGDIINLPPFQGIMRTRALGMSQPVFTLRLVPEDQFDLSRALGRPAPQPPQRR